MYNTIGFRIKELRRKNNLTQKELAEKIGTDLGTISRYEKGIISPKRRIKLLADALKVSVEYLEHGDDSADSNVASSLKDLSYEDLQVVSKFRKLGERGKTTILDMLAREVALSRAYAE